MDIRFDGKVVGITGAAGGIGTAMVRAYVASGAKVAVCDLKQNESLLAEIKAAGGEAIGVNLDVTDRQSVAKAMTEIEERLGGIDVWVNNAGINVGPEERNKIDKFSDKWWDAILAVDLTGTFNCSKAVIPYMEKRGGGSILNVSSATGMVPLRNQCGFVAAKAGVIKLSQAMAIELAERKIRVNVLSPGSVGLAITNRLWSNSAAMEGLLAHIPQHRQGTAEEMAQAAIYLTSNCAEYVTGAVFPVDGGWLAGYTRDF